MVDPSGHSAALIYDGGGGGQTLTEKESAELTQNIMTVGAEQRAEREAMEAERAVKERGRAQYDKKLRKLEAASGGGDACGGSLCASSDWLQKASPNITRWKDLILAASAKHGVPPQLIAAIMMHEGGGTNHLEINASGDAGLMQLNLKAQQVTLAEATAPAFAVDHATRYLGGLFRNFGGDQQKAIQAYNYGEGNVGDLVTDYGDSWMRHRTEITGGDPQYYEHVMFYLGKWR